MSSAAVQPANSAIPNRQYQTNSPQSRDQYYTQQSQSSPSATIPPSAKRHSSRPSNGASVQIPQHHYSPAPVASASGNSTPRGQTYIPSNNSPTVATADPSPSFAMHSNNPGSQPPPRTSSSAHRHTSSTASASDSRVTRAGTTGSANAFAYGDFPQPAATDSSARRQAQQSSRSGNASSVETPSTHSRSASSTQHPPRGSDLPRENSTVINRVVTSDPQEDIARERDRMNEAHNMPPNSDITPVTGLGLVGSEGVEDGGRGASSTGRPRQERSERSNKRETKFGEYILGQTLGEGEFGKVKMGWKREGGVQVAIKLIRKDSLGTNPSRLPKIYREISILRGLQHPNIVRLHEMVETERHIGIILEYASGGELFDYILQHRYLKDNAARRLFAQLVSGVGYLHKKGIVHRDLKLENLLLDRNRNIIITDFGFANTFTPGEELGVDIEYSLADRDFVRKMGLEQLGPDGHRRGDLMQTSCGSPCYAAPELVVSDSLYTGRKVDVWSCGVILYAMLAGYLPFDDDPANPEGDNINLLYKYIVSTPLTFPEYVTPHARDLLKRILVPDPRKRADLFEVARHSWLSEYASVVGFITSNTTTPKDIANTTVGADTFNTPQQLARSASVREPSKPSNVVIPIVGGLTNKNAAINEPVERSTTPRDAKRRTVQVEYVAPQSATVRGDGTGKSRARGAAPSPIEIPQSQADVYRHDQQQNSAPSAPSMMPPASRPARDQQRAISEYVAVTSPTSNQRPVTQGSMTQRIPMVSRSSYGTPSVGVSQDSATGRFSQPEKKAIKQSNVPAVESHDDLLDQQLPQTPGVNVAYAAPTPHLAGSRRESYQQHAKGHKRSSTIGERIGSIFGRNSMSVERREEEAMAKAEKKAAEKPERREKRYPPTSMKGPMSNDAQDYQQQQQQQLADAPRKSTDSRRTSFSFSRKTTKDPDQASITNTHRSSRRFSIIPASLKKLAHRGDQDDLRQYGSNEEAIDGSNYSGSVPPSKSRRNSRARFGFGMGRTHSRASSRAYDFNDEDARIPGSAYFDEQHTPAVRVTTGSRQGAAPTSAPVMASMTANALNPAVPASAVPQRETYNVMQHNTNYLDDNIYSSHNRYPSRTPDNATPNTVDPALLSSEPPPRSAGTDSYGISDTQSYQSAQQQLPHASNNAGYRQASGPYPPGFNEGDDNMGPPRSAAGYGAKAQGLQKHKKFSDGYDGSEQSSGSGKRVMDFFRRMGKQRGGGGE